MTQVYNVQLEREYPWVSPGLTDLVDRHPQIDDFTAVLDRINRQLSSTKPLFEWYGGPGIGKSQLIRLLVEVCHKKQYPWTEIKFNHPKAAHYADDPTKLIEMLVAQLKQSTYRPSDQFINKTNELSLHIEAFRHHYALPQKVTDVYSKLTHNERYYERPLWLNHLREATITFIQALNELSVVSTPSYSRGERRGFERIQPVTLFFDETEYASANLTDWIEEWVINPAIQLKHVVIVWAARQPWRWKRPEVRRRVRSEQLSIFEQDIVKQQLESQLRTHNVSLAEALFQSVVKTTDGHPFANAVVISQIDEWITEGEEVTAEFIAAHESDLLNEIFEHFVDGYVLRELTTELKEAIKLLTMVRIFDSALLSKIMRECGSGSFTVGAPKHGENLLVQLKQTQLVVWAKGYAIDPDLRGIIRKYYLKCKPDLFKAVNDSALEMYQRLLEKPIDNRNLFVIEELYHFASLRQAGEAHDLSMLFEKRLEEYSYYITDPLILNYTLERLQGELKHDQELSKLTDGLTQEKLVDLVDAYKFSYEDDAQNQDTKHNPTSSIAIP